MKSKALLNSFIQPVLNFASFYHEYKVKSEKLVTAKYRMVTTLEEFKQTNLIQLSFTDNPGDMLAPVSIENIKNTPDIMAGMHPIDVNTINDLHYLSKDKIIEMKVNNDSIIALKKDGTSISYDISDHFDPNTISSTRLSYMIGYMQAEKLMRKAYSTKDKYRIMTDNITTLEIMDIEANNYFLKNPLDLLFSDDYKNFSKEDVGRIGYICGQMSKI